MKRPLAAIGFMYLAAQIIAVFGGPVVSLTLFFVLAAALALYILLVRRRSVAVIALIASAAACFMLHSAYEYICVCPSWMLEGREAYITARITEQPRGSDGSYFCYITTRDIKVKNAPRRVRLKLLSGSPIDADVDDIITCRVSFSRSEAMRSSVLSARARGAVAIARMIYGEQPSVEHGSPSLYGRITRLRMRLIAAIKRMYDPEHAAILTGLMLGDTSYMDDRMIRMFRVCGISHYLAVSGLHLSALSFALVRLMTLLGVPVRARSAVMPPFIVFFMALTGFSPSVTRAGIMLVLYHAARALSRESDGLNSLGAAALIICLARPYAAADAGLLMSVSCSLGLMTLAPRLQRYSNRLIYCRYYGTRAVLLSRLAGAAITPLVASAAAFPVSSLYFGELSLITVPCNMLCLYPATGFFLLGALSVLLSLVPFAGGTLSLAPYFAARLCAIVLTAIVRICSAPSWVSVNVDYRVMPAAVALCALLSGTAYFLYRNGTSQARGQTARIIMALAVILAAAGISAERLQAHSKEEILIVNAGGGISCCARHGGNGMLFGAGGDRASLRRMTDALDGMKLLSLDVMTLPEDSPEYMSHADEIISMYFPRRVFMPGYGTFTDRAKSAYYRTRRPADTCVTADSDMKWYDTGKRVGFEIFTDSGGSRWYRVFTGQLEALIVPEGGDCALLPEEYRSPDIVILRSDDIADPSALDTELFVLCADQENCAFYENTLRRRGISRICSAAECDTVRITAFKDGIKLEEAKKSARY